MISSPLFARRSVVVVMHTPLRRQTGPDLLRDRGMAQRKTKRVSEAPQPERRISARDYPVVPLRVFLAHCHFNDNGPAAEEVAFPEETDFLTGLVFARPSARILGVAMRLTTTEASPVTIDITYAAEFEVNSEVTDEERERLFETVGYDTAPALLYTYIREFFSNLTARWRGGPVALPLLPLPPYAKGERPPIPTSEAPPQGRGRRITRRTVVAARGE